MPLNEQLTSFFELCCGFDATDARKRKHSGATNHQTLHEQLASCNSASDSVEKSIVAHRSKESRRGSLEQVQRLVEMREMLDRIDAVTEPPTRRVKRTSTERRLPQQP